VLSLSYISWICVNLFQDGTEVKEKLNELSELLFSNVNQELSNKFNLKKDDIINWIEEIEFEITNYEQN
jgi:hypothetical protein